MKSIQEKERTLPVLAETDILVVGSGPAGASAAIAASRMGEKTMLVERYGCFGGVITQVGVENIAWYRHEQTIEAGGLAFEYEKRALALGACANETQSVSQALDTEMFKYILDNMVLEAGVTPLLHSLASAAIIEDDRIKGIIVEGKSGRQAILAKRVIDCSGDADVAASAGVSFTKLPKEKSSHVTPIFSCRGVDINKFKKYIYEDLQPTYKEWVRGWGVETNGKEDELFAPYLLDAFNQAIKEGLIDVDPDVRLAGTFSTMSQEGDVTTINVVFIKNCDCTNVFDLTRAEITGRKSVLQAITALKAYVPGFENARLRNFGMTLGTRESRLISGNYTLSAHDVMNQARFDDSIGIFPEFIDGGGKIWIPTTGRYFQIPYRVLVPRTIDNLLVAGRCISGEKGAHSAFRNMNCCVTTGQGAGVVAAVSLKQGVTTSQVNVKEVQSALKEQDVRVD
ncbi:pyridine nucleotide-disulfide oxidoreductase [Spirochaetia bacterium]|nr:pyridine nucleotide-disulfide oxidoreductase [Spirochaetia bacterium]